MTESALTPEAEEILHRSADRFSEALTHGVDFGLGYPTMLEILEALRHGGEPDLGTGDERAWRRTFADKAAGAIAIAGEAGPALRDTILDALFEQARSEERVAGLDWKLS